MVPGLSAARKLFLAGLRQNAGTNENRSVRTTQSELANRRQHLARSMFNQQMQKLLKGAVEGELSVARDHRFAFPKIDVTRNAQGPLNFHHTCQMARV